MWAKYGVKCSTNDFKSRQANSVGPLIKPRSKRGFSYSLIKLREIGIQFHIFFIILGYVRVEYINVCYFNVFNESKQFVKTYYKML